MPAAIEQQLDEVLSDISPLGGMRSRVLVARIEALRTRLQVVQAINSGSEPPYSIAEEWGRIFGTPYTKRLIDKTDKAHAEIDRLVSTRYRIPRRLVHSSNGELDPSGLVSFFFTPTQYKIDIVKEFAIKITHHLMKRKDIQREDIKTIMAHPQVLKQCQNTLKLKYKNLKLESGEGDLIDTTNAAKALSEDKVAKTVAILGPKNISDLYNLEVIDQNLQNNPENYTPFLLVKRYNP